MVVLVIWFKERNSMVQRNIAKCDLNQEVLILRCLRKKKNFTVVAIVDQNYSYLVQRLQF